MRTRVAMSLGPLAMAIGLAVASPAAAHPGDPAERRARLAAQQGPEPPITATPRAQCLPGSHPEPAIQGRVPAEEVDAGRADRGYWCNVTQIGHHGATGGYKVLRYVDKHGHECLYYDTTLLFPTNATSLSLEPTGVAVLDMSDPRKPVRTDTLLTPAMQTPHESLNISVQRGVLAAVTGNPMFYPGIVDIYDLTQDCRHPLLQSSTPSAPWGHESGMAPDGMTFYPTSIGTGHTTALDIRDPKAPRQLWVGDYNTHGMTVSDDGTRGYMATGDGLVILDLTEIQNRAPDPQPREISRLTWSNMTIPQVAHPVTIGGKPYVVEVDEFAQTEDGQTTAHGPRVGAARIIDVSDETKPFVVSNIRLEVHQPEHREAIADDYGTRSPVQGYAAHYCGVPQRREPGIVACSMITSGLRVFDIRDPKHPKEIAYFVAPPSTVSATGAAVIDERANFAMSQPTFVPERGEIWYSDGTSGFHVLKVDPRVWPFPVGVEAPGCTDNSGLTGLSASATRGGVRLRFTRTVDLPVRVDIFRLTRGRRIVKARRVARFSNRRRSVTWRGKAGPGYYVARLTMLRERRPFDTRSLVLQRDTRGRFRQRPAFEQPDGCALVRRFRLDRPVFGGSGNVPLRATYRLAAPARVMVTISRGGRVVKRFVTASRPANRTLRVTLPARGLRPGDYTVRLRAVSGEDLAAVELTARRL